MPSACRSPSRSRRDPSSAPARPRGSLAAVADARGERGGLAAGRQPVADHGGGVPGARRGRGDRPAGAGAGARPGRRARDGAAREPAAHRDRQRRAPLFQQPLGRADRPRREPRAHRPQAFARGFGDRAVRVVEAAAARCRLDGIPRREPLRPVVEVARDPTPDRRHARGGGGPAWRRRFPRAAAPDQLEGREGLGARQDRNDVVRPRARRLHRHRRRAGGSPSPSSSTTPRSARRSTRTSTRGSGRSIRSPGRGGTAPSSWSRS